MVHPSFDGYGASYLLFYCYDQCFSATPLIQLFPTDRISQCQSPQLSVICISCGKLCFVMALCLVSVGFKHFLNTSFFGITLLIYLLMLGFRLRWWHAYQVSLAFFLVGMQSVGVSPRTEISLYFRIFTLTSKFSFESHLRI